MANETPFTLDGSNRLSPTIADANSLAVGSGIEPNVSGADMTIGADAGTITIGAVGETVSFPGTISPTPSIANGVQKKTVTVAFNNAALVAAASNGATATVNISTALPSNSRILGVDFRSMTPFTGGSASAVDVAVGTSGDVDALVAEADVLTAAVDGGPSAITPGVRPWKTYASGGQLIATFTPDAGHQLALLTAGSVVIDVLYTVLA